MKFISVGLFSNETLEEIHLDDNDIKDEGFQYFIRKEKKLSGNMKTISFSSKFPFELKKLENSISKGNLVKKFLTNNCNVTNLDISENKIGKGLSLILENLKENKTLTSLNLNGNHIKKEGLKDLLSLLDENKILKNVECHSICFYFSIFFKIIKLN
jgi:Ran GTPase-activating protein (RanGAP) involved in mRNA processing and transport